MNDAPDSDGFTRRDLISYLTGLGWPFRRRVVGWLALIVLRSAALAVFVRLLDQAVSALRQGPDAAGSAVFWMAAGGLIGCQIVVAVCQYLADETQRWALEGMEVAAVRGGLESLLRLPPDYFQRHSLAKLVLKLEKLEHVVRAVVTQGANIISRLAAMTGLLSGAVWAEPLLGSLGLGAMIVVTMILWRRTDRLRELARQEFTLDVGLVQRVHELFAQPRDLHNFPIRQRALDRFSECAEQMAARSLQKVRVYSGAAAWLNSSVVLVMGALLAAALLRDQPLGGAVTCFAAVGLSLEPLAEVFRARMSLENRGARLGHLLQLIGQLAEAPADGLAQPPAEIWHRLDVDDVSWETDAGHAVLRSVSLSLRRGEIVGLVGRSGSGKTTLASLLLRLIEPTVGRIAVDGSDIRNLDLAAFWSQVAYVPQLPLLGGARTAGEELALGTRDATPETIAAALDAVGLCSETPLDLLASDSDGSTAAPVGEVRALRQRIEWARALLRQAQLVVLDEPTDSADERYEQQFLAALASGRSHQITLLISHRPETLALCDRILVLDHGTLLAETTSLAAARRFLGELPTEWNRAA